MNDGDLLSIVSGEVLRNVKREVLVPPLNTLAYINTRQLAVRRSDRIRQQPRDQAVCDERDLPNDIILGSHRICPLRIMFTISKP
jgi:hypothetical protein